jgi:capsular exopolysaccharide synthesis family protein
LATTTASRRIERPARESPGEPPDLNEQVEPAMLLSPARNRRNHHGPQAVPAAEDPIEQQISAAGNLNEAQVKAIRGFQHRHGLTFGQAAATLGLLRRDTLFAAVSKQRNFPILNPRGSGARFSRELVAGYRPHSRTAECYRTVRSALAIGPLSQGRNAFAVVGATSRVGVTNFAANLALSFAQMSVPTLLIEANLRKPRLASLFGLDRTATGLVEALTLGKVDRPLPTFEIIPNLSLIVAGATAPHPQELLISGTFLTLSQSVQRNNGVVIYDTPPATDSADAYVVASRVGSAIIVARRHRTTVKDIQKTAHVLASHQCQIVGTVLGQF